LYLKLDKELDKIFKRVMKDNAASIDTNIARNLSKNKKIRYLREKNRMYIGLDRNKKKSVVFIPPQYKPKKTKRGYFFP